MRKREIANGHFSLYLDIYVNGKRKKEYLKLYLTGSKKDKEVLAAAEKMRVKTEHEINMGTYLDSKSMKIDFYDFYDKYSAKFGRKEKKDSLVNFHMRAVRPKLSFEEINEDFWFELKNRFIKLGHSPYNIFIEFRTLKSLVNAAVKMEIVPKSNLSKITEKRPSTYREYLVFEELQKLSQTKCRLEYVKNAFLFACYTGLRYSDLESLTFGNIKNGQIELKQQKTQDFVYIPISQHALKYIPDLSVDHLDTEPIFGHLPKGTVHSALREWVAAAGITKKVMFHTSRHTFATLALTYGVELETVSSLLGHKDLSTTQIYAKIISKKKEEAINKLPSL
ncbi:MAG: tyrosine-type recombinase/integrase [Vampirovibrionia bacterium]